MDERTEVSDVADDLVTTGEAARLFRVDVRTMRKYVAEGRVSAKRTPAGQLRFSRRELLSVLDGEGAA